MAITLTEAAARHVTKYLARRGKGVGVRLGVKTTGCSGLAFGPRCRQRPTHRLAWRRTRRLPSRAARPPMVISRNVMYLPSPSAPHPGIGHATEPGLVCPHASHCNRKGSRFSVLSG